ncbi:LOW QUALITY PROTEIN: sialic acid synthase-like [Sceloporus undulatus]|uniref:LOW QUALITY PROTEIN: sialic acid synthase-like n=1 Tax=Sceloporus undulatus TaxID=8520 RepID=UPI001C4D6431|nr:LOW QUALITY PROTEIN: sialic acid synthase-like [Sceloporus undulatus]
MKHKTDIAISFPAVVMGVKVLEHHIMLDKTWKEGSDHEVTLEPNELVELVRNIRMVEKAMEWPVKQLLPCEVACNEKLGKSGIAKIWIPEGTMFTLDMLTAKIGEPKGYPPEGIFDLLGKNVKVTIVEDDTIVEDVFEKSEILN